MPCHLLIKSSDDMKAMVPGGRVESNIGSRNDLSIRAGRACGRCALERSRPGCAGYPCGGAASRQRASDAANPTCCLKSREKFAGLE